MVSSIHQLAAVVLAIVLDICLPLTGPLLAAEGVTAQLLLQRELVTPEARVTGWARVVFSPMYVPYSYVPVLSSGAVHVALCAILCANMMHRNVGPLLRRGVAGHVGCV